MRTPDPLVTVAGQVAKVANQLAETEAKIGELVPRVDQLEALIEPLDVLVERVKSLAETIQARPINERGNHVDPRPWCAVIRDEPDEEGTVPAARDLAAWLETVIYPHYGEYLRFGHGRPIGRFPDCWPQHRAVASELWTLYQLWDDAYSNPEAGPRAAGDWHDRWLPGVLERVQKILASCPHTDTGVKAP